MKQVRVLTGWRLWAVVVVFSFGFFLAAFSLLKVSSSAGGRWDISWAAVGWLTVAVGGFVSVSTRLGSGKKW